MDLTFTREEIPKINRAGGSGREAEPWEQHLGSLKDPENAGTSFRVWTYDKRSSAVSRMSSVRERLSKAVPHENWILKVRPTPEDAEKFGVYVQFDGNFTPEQITENARKHAERSKRVSESRAKAAATRAAGETPAAEAPLVTDTTPSAEGDAPSAKERVASTHAKQKAGAGK